MTQPRRPLLISCLVLGVALLVALLIGPASARGGDPISGGAIGVPEGAPESQAARSSSGIAITAGGDTLLVVNPDSGSLTLVDTATHSSKLGRSLTIQDPYVQWLCVHHHMAKVYPDN